MIDLIVGGDEASLTVPLLWKWLQFLVKTVRSPICEPDFIQRQRLGETPSQHSKKTHTGQRIGLWVLQVNYLNITHQRISSNMAASFSCTINSEMATFNQTVSCNSTHNHNAHIVTRSPFKITEIKESSTGLNCLLNIHIITKRNHPLICRNIY